MPDSEEEIVNLATNAENRGFANSGITGPSNMGVIGDAGVILPKPRKKELNFERGVTYSWPFSTMYHGLHEVWNKEKVKVAQLEAMLKTDGHAQALYRLITLPIRSSLKTSTILPISGVEGGEEEASFIDLMLNMPPASGGMVVPINQLISQVLLGVFYGFSAFELVYWVPKQGPLAGKITLRKASYRPSETVHYLTNDNNEFAGWRQIAYVNNRYIDVELPADDMMMYVCNSEIDPLYGVSMFATAFWHYDKKKKLEYLMHLAAQKGALGTRIGTMPPNPNKADKDHFLRALSELGSQQWMAVPIDWTVTSLQESGKFDFMPAIEYHNHMMSESVLASFFDGNDTGGKSPLVNFSSQDDTLFIQMLETIMDDVASMINNQLIPRFIDWNFGTGNYPTFHWGPFTDEQKDAIQAAFSQIAIAPETNIAPEISQALQLKWAEDVGLNLDADTLQSQFAKQNQQNDQLQQLTFKTNLVQQNNALEAAADPLAAQQQGIGPNGQPLPPPKVTPPVPGAKSTSTQAVPAKATTSKPPAAKKVSAAKKVTQAKKVSAAPHPAVKRAAAATEKNPGNTKPKAKIEVQSPKSKLQQEKERRKERDRGH